MRNQQTTCPKTHVLARQGSIRLYFSFIPYSITHFSSSSFIHLMKGQPGQFTSNHLKSPPLNLYFSSQSPKPLCSLFRTHTTNHTPFAPVSHPFIQNRVKSLIFIFIHHHFTLVSQIFHQISFTYLQEHLGFKKIEGHIQVVAGLERSTCGVHACHESQGLSSISSCLASLLSFLVI